ncbi:MAG TPA: 30S ribosomal protein S6 [Candidatus Omnitrophica bacterium]|nr:30S ribosomal protein S6 [Candidatus Omnitrophota bacterium]
MFATRGCVVNREYEALLILNASGSEAELAQAVKQVEEPIRKLGGQIDKSEGWGRRRLAYRINRHLEGHYHLLRFQVDPNQVEELKRLLRLNEAVMRFLILHQANGGVPEVPALSKTHAEAAEPVRHPARV